MTVRTIGALGLALFMAFTFDKGLLDVLLVLGLVVAIPVVKSPRKAFVVPGTALGLAPLSSWAGWKLSAMDARPAWAEDAAALLFLVWPEWQPGALWSTPPLVACSLLIVGPFGLCLGVVAIAS